MSKGQSVCARLQGEYRVPGRPGHKTRCPECLRKKTLSITRDDQLAKCFGPGCTFKLTAHKADPVKGRVAEILKKIFREWKQSLLGSDGVTSDAWRYLIEKRLVHERVIKDAPLGIVPAGFDADECFAALIAELEKSEPTSDEKSVPEDKSQDKKPSAVERVKEIRDKLKNCTKGTAGWIAFFYKDVSGHVVAIRIRRPFSKTLFYFKPFSNAGLFGHTMTEYLIGEPPAPFTEICLIVEGEFNVLQLQSNALRYAEKNGLKRFYVHAAAVGGVNNADHHAIRTVSDIPVICYDNDVSGAGYHLVERAAEDEGIWACTTPGEGSDLDDYICSFGEKYNRAWKRVCSIVRDRKFIPRSLEGIREQIGEARKRYGQKPAKEPFEVDQDVAEIVRTELLSRGKFYHEDQRAFWFDRTTKTLYEIDGEDGQFDHLLTQFGINTSERLHKYVTEDLGHYALEHGEESEIHCLGHYKESTYTLYVHLAGNKVRRISADSIDVVDNGANGVLFIQQSNQEPADVAEIDVPDDRSFIHDQLISKINFKGAELTPAEQRIVFLAWFYALFFLELMPTKAVLSLIGEKGSGKSCTLRKVGRLLFGPKFDVTPLSVDRRDFETVAANSVLFAIDNADSPCGWFDDALASAATGCRIRRRRLYANNQVIEFPIRCFLAITARTPEFRRDDVAQRLLILHVDQYGSFFSERTILKHIMDLRPKLWAEIIDHLQEIVQALKAETGNPYSGQFRMADFADFAMKIARYAGIGRTMETIFQKLSQSQASFVLDGDTILQLMVMWEAIEGNSGKKVDVNTLCSELTKVAKEEGIEFEFAGNHRGLAQRLSRIKDELRKYFDMNIKSAGGNRRLYSFRILDDAQLPNLNQ